MIQENKKMMQIKVTYQEINYFFLIYVFILYKSTYCINLEEIAQKYRELRKREVVMDEFLNNFEESKQNETEQLYNTRRTIVNYLEIISKVWKK
jgi:hypothetical protein